MIFYLNWTEKRPTQIKIINEKPECNFETSIMINKKKVIICGMIHDQFMKYYPPHKLPYSKNQ